jgi:hypothetical protein
MYTDIMKLRGVLDWIERLYTKVPVPTEDIEGYDKFPDWGKWLLHELHRRAGKAWGVIRVEEDGHRIDREELAKFLRALDVDILTGLERADALIAYLDKTRGKP